MTSKLSVPSISNRSSCLSVLGLLLLFVALSGCVSQRLLDSPLCPERDFVLQPVSVIDQSLMQEASPQGFAVLADNDVQLKSYLREIEAVVAAHDEPLGGCD